MKKINWRRYGLYHAKWQIGAVVCIPCLYLFLDVLKLDYWLAVFLFQLIGAIIFYPIDMWILKLKKKNKKERDFHYCQREIEDESACEIQCSHCQEYYGPLEEERKREKNS